MGNSNEEVGGLKRFNHPLSNDPRSSSDAKDSLKMKAMADFRRQKRTRQQREQGDLDGSDRDDGPCFCLLLFIVSMLTSLFLLCVLFFAARFLQPHGTQSVRRQQPT